MVKKSRMTSDTLEAEDVVEALFDRNGGAQKKTLVIPPINFLTFETTITGSTPLVLNKFSEKARQQMMDTQSKGSKQAGKTRGAKPAKDFDACYKDAQHVFDDGSGWGIPCGSFRWALVTACGLVGFHMTKGKMCLFVIADGHEVDGTPLVKITRGEPKKVTHTVRNDGGTADVRARPCWDPGWQARLRIQFDADYFTPADVANLLHRAGIQVGIGEGRPYSKKSVGMGWGQFLPESAQS